MADPSSFSPGNFTNITTLGQNLRMRAGISSLRQDIAEAERQMASGFKSESHGGLRASATVAQELRHRLDRIKGYEGSIATVNMRLTTVQKALNTVQTGSEKLIETVRSAYAPGFPETIQHSRVEARLTLGSSISVLNSSQGNRYLFSGSDVATPPVVNESTMIDGGSGHMGLSDVVALRLQADMGVGNTGRLSTGAAAGVVTVTHDGGAFGMRLTNISGPAGSVTAPPVAETAANTVAGTVNTASLAVGEQAMLTFEMPDGSTKSITMIAGTAPLPTSNAADTYYFEQGNDASFKSVLDGGISTIINRDMTGASGMAAANDFFDHEAPRIPSGAAATATELAVSSATVVDWYQGETAVQSVKGPANDPTAVTPSKGDVYMIGNAPPAATGVWTGNEGKLAVYNGTGWNYIKPEEGTRVIAAAPSAGQPDHMYTYDSASGTWTDSGIAPEQTNARNSVKSKVDDTLSVAHGARADEAGVRDTLKLAALVAAADLDTSNTAPFQQVLQKVAERYDSAHDDIIAIQAELGVVEERVKTLSASHKDFKTILNNQIVGVEGIDDFEVSTRLQEMLARLQSSYKIVAQMSSLNLAAYL